MRPGGRLLLCVAVVAVVGCGYVMLLGPSLSNANAEHSTQGAARRRQRPVANPDAPVDAIADAPSTEVAEATQDPLQKAAFSRRDADSRSLPTNTWHAKLFGIPSWHDFAMPDVGQAQQLHRWSMAALAADTVVADAEADPPQRTQYFSTLRNVLTTPSHKLCQEVRKEHQPLRESLNLKTELCYLDVASTPGVAAKGADAEDFTSAFRRAVTDDPPSVHGCRGLLKLSPATKSSAKRLSVCAASHSAHVSGDARWADALRSVFGPLHLRVLFEGPEVSVGQVQFDAEACEYWVHFAFRSPGTYHVNAKIVHSDFWGVDETLHRTKHAFGKYFLSRSYPPLTCYPDPVTRKAVGDHHSGGAGTGDSVVVDGGINFVAKQRQQREAQDKAMLNDHKERFGRLSDLRGDQGIARRSAIGLNATKVFLGGTRSPERKRRKQKPPPPPTDANGALVQLTKTLSRGVTAFGPLVGAAAGGPSARPYASTQVPVPATAWFGRWLQRPHPLTPFAGRLLRGNTLQWLPSDAPVAGVDPSVVPKFGIFKKTPTVDGTYKTMGSVAGAEVTHTPRQLSWMAPGILKQCLRRVRSESRRRPGSRTVRKARPSRHDPSASDPDIPPDLHPGAVRIFVTGDSQARSVYWALKNYFSTVMQYGESSYRAAAFDVATDPKAVQKLADGNAALAGSQAGAVPGADEPLSYERRDAGGNKVKHADALFFENEPTEDGNAGGGTARGPLVFVYYRWDNYLENLERFSAGADIVVAGFGAHPASWGQWSYAKFATESERVAKILCRRSAKKPVLFYGSPAWPKAKLVENFRATNARLAAFNGLAIKAIQDECEAARAVQQEQEKGAAPHANANAGAGGDGSTAAAAESADGGGGAGAAAPLHDRTIGVPLVNFFELSSAQLKLSKDGAHYDGSVVVAQLAHEVLERACADPGAPDAL